MGESSEIFPKQLCFFNELDDSIHGMHLSLAFVLQSHRLSLPEKKLPVDAFLALVNFSRSGWPLRVQLLPNRRWLVSQNLVFEIDPPQDYQDKYDEDDFAAHFAYQIILRNDQEEFFLEESSQRARTWEQLDQIEIVVRELNSQEEVDVLRPGESFDTVKIVVWDRDMDQEVTEQFWQPKNRVEAKCGLQLCLINENAQTENVWVWARDVLNPKEIRANDIDPQTCSTYFEYDPVHSEKELKRAPSRRVTSSDICSFGIQRFRILFEGVLSYNSKTNEVYNQKQSTKEEATYEDGEKFRTKSFIRAL